MHSLLDVTPKYADELLVGESSVFFGRRRFESDEAHPHVQVTNEEPRLKRVRHATRLVERLVAGIVYAALVRRDGAANQLRTTRKKVDDVRRHASLTQSKRRRSGVKISNDSPQRHLRTRAHAQTTADNIFGVQLLGNAKVSFLMPSEEEAGLL